jgi:hypothetical protein
MSIYGRRCPAWLALGALIPAILLSACGDGGSGAPTPPPPTSSGPSPTNSIRGGYFSGQVGRYYAEGIVTEDGSARLYIQGPPRDASEEFEPVQFVGSLAPKADWSAVGAGILIGERCRSTTDGRFCNGGVPAELELTSLGARLLEGRLIHQAGDWAGDVGLGLRVIMTWPSDTYAVDKASFEMVEGTYWERLADFAHDGDVISIVDGAGRWFFQSAHTGCTGNGALTPHGDGALNVYQVELLIENCDANYDYLNRSFLGLATRSFGDWNWGDWLVLFLSSPDGEPNPVALTMWGERQ